MPATRELAEAQAFVRRRLVRAFVTGLPDADESLGGRPGRTVVAGIALAVLVVLGAVVVDLLSERPPRDWDGPGVVISEESGMTYVVLDRPRDQDALPVLHPVSDLTSARLLLGDDALAPTIVAQAVVGTRPVGGEVGIPGAPAAPPEVDDLVDTGWTACVGSPSDVRLELPAEPSVVVEQQSRVVLVRQAGTQDLWLVGTGAATPRSPAQARRYALPPGDPGRADALLRELGFPGGGADAAPVPRDWLALFPRGGDLTVEAFGLEGLGAPAPSQPQGVPVGHHVTTGGGGLLVDDRGRLQPLTPFALAVWRGLDVVHAAGLPATALGGGSAAPAYDAAGWPAARPVPADERPCAVLDSAADRAPLVRLGTWPADTFPAATSESPPRRGEVTVEVAPGAGAHVVVDEPGSEEPGEEGPRRLVDGSGRAHLVEGAETSGLLGYRSHRPPWVPAAWIDLLREGVLLSREAALCTVEAERSCAASR